MKKSVIVVAMAVFLSAFMILPCFGASDVQSVSALSYFSGGTYYWGYNTVSANTVCDIETFTSVRDWSIPFPYNEMIKSGYFSENNNLGVSFVGGNGGSTGTYPNAMCTINFTKPMNFVGGMTYQFCLRIGSFMLYDINGNGVHFEEKLQTVICQVGTSQSLYFSIERGSGNYSEDYLLTFKPAEDTAVNALIFLFTNTNNSSGNVGQYNSCSGSLTFSNMICYSGDGDYISTHPQLDSISGQLDDIKSQLGNLNEALINNPYGEITAPPRDNAGELVGESAAILNADGVFNRAELVINGIPSESIGFWPSVMELIFNWSIFVPFILVGAAFIVSRALLGR